jgi:hypothetical protein
MRICCHRLNRRHPSVDRRQFANSSLLQAVLSVQAVLSSSGGDRSSTTLVATHTTISANQMSSRTHGYRPSRKPAELAVFERGAYATHPKSPSPRVVNQLPNMHRPAPDPITTTIRCRTFSPPASIVRFSQTFLEASADAPNRSRSSTANRRATRTPVRARHRRFQSTHCVREHDAVATGGRRWPHHGSR